MIQSQNLLHAAKGLWMFVTSFQTCHRFKMIMGMRVADIEEYRGLDITKCGVETCQKFTGSSGTGI